MANFQVESVLVMTIACIFGLGLLLSLLRGFKYAKPILERFPLVDLFVPSWSFFAPVPGMLDYHIFYRELFNDGVKGKWKQSYELPDHRPWYTFLWNPDKRFVKAVLDMAPDLLRLSNLSQNKNQICVSLPYLYILNYISSLHRSTFTEKIQFMLVANSRLRKPEVLFVSEFHSVK